MKIFLAAVLLSACAASRAEQKPRSKSAAAPDPSSLSAFAFDPKVPLADRVADIPPWLLDGWRKEDNAPEYVVYRPTEDERREFAKALDGLPAPMKRVLNERLVAFYFVSNLKGNGITTWTLDPAKNVYSYMILNPAGFKKSVSQILTDRELSPFGGSGDLYVDAGPGSGILYTVAHECLHAFDYAQGVTPFTEPGLEKELGRPTDRGWDVWKSYFVPFPEDDYPARAKLHFYGFGAPELSASDLPAACAALAKSPFTSFYGSRAWAEDAAELFVVRHLTQDLGLPYRVRCGGAEREPMKDPVVKARAEKLLASVYRL